MLLCGTDHAVIKRLGVNNRLHGHPQVRRFIDHHVAVAGADTDGGRAGGIRGMDHAGTAGGHNQIHLLHQNVGDFQGGCLDPADDMFRHPGLYGGVPHDLCSGNGTLHRMGMGREDDRIPGLQGQHDFIDRCGCRIGGGSDSRNHTFGRGDALCPESRVLLNNPAGLGIAHIVPDVFRGILVLGHLIHDDTVASLFAGHFCQRNAHFGNGHGSFFADGIHLFLGK